MQLRLGLVHAVTLLGLVLGGFTAAYFFGYRVGRTEQFELKSAEALEKMPRIPIPEEEKPQKVPERLVSEVYAKLQDGNLPPVDEEKNPEKEDTELELKPVKIVPLEREEAPPKEEKTLADLEEPKKTTEKEAEKKAQSEEAKVVKKEEVVAEKPVAKKVEEPVKVEATPKPTEAPKQAVAGLFELGNTQKKAAETKAVPAKTLTRSKTASSSSKLISGWYVQLAAHETPNEAESLLKLLKENGFLDAKIQTATVDGKKYYRVLVGPEETTLLAKRLRDQLKREPYVQFKPYLRRVQ